MKADDVLKSVAGIVFIGTEGGVSPSFGMSQGELCEAEVDRLVGRLERHGRALSSILAAEVFYDPAIFAGNAVVDGLAAALPDDCGPCTTWVVLEPGSLGDRGIAIQLVSTGETVVPGDSERFPTSAAAGEIVAVAGQVSLAASDMVGQTQSVMNRIKDLLARHGVTFDDVVRTHIFFVGEGKKKAWEICARERAKYYVEPGPVGTGIPFRVLPQTGALIVVRVMAVRNARTLGLRAHAWPEGHWDWTIHMPYQHGCDIGGTVFVGGQVSMTKEAKAIDPGDLASQTRRCVHNIVRVLQEVKADSDDILRLTAFYKHAAPDDKRVVKKAIEQELPGPEIELSLIPVPYLAYEDLVVEIDADARRSS